ncbi:EAL domain-containing protein [Massilia sp. GCM10023247]|uniref:EAL domain-containing protein n=1 Tax=Massilia sp. GCM10023247 TaxID=3252643 RepID=UPI003607F5E3
MPNPTVHQRSSPSSAANVVLEEVVRVFAYYLIPIGIGLFSFVALLFWHNQYKVSEPASLPLKVLVQEEGAVLTPAQALARLASATAVARYDTNLSSKPIWFSFAPVPGPAGQDVIEFPSRHSLSIRCWDAAGLRPLGEASRASAHGAIEAVKAGFALNMARLPAQLLCNGTFAGPAQVSVLQWPAQQFASSVEQYHRKSGLLDGGMIVLALFVLLTALINRQPLYVLFSGWLILNLRVGALSAGWDIQWLGQTIPADLLLLSRSVTLTLYGIATLALYQNLLRTSLEDLRYGAAMRFMQSLALPLLACAILLPYHVYLPVLWVTCACCLAIMIAGMFKVIVESRNRVASWFAAAFALAVVATLVEIVSAALGMHEVVGFVNSVTAALASSLLAALAVAEQMRAETEQREEAQRKLEHAYEAMPVGLFTLDMSGHFQSANPALQKMLGVMRFLPGRTAWHDFFDQSVWKELHEQVHGRADAELEIANHEGTRRFLVSATLARGRIEGVLQDITEKYKATEQLRFMADHDPLTKVFNRRGIEKMFEEAAVSLATGKPMALAYIDLDRFKLINDLFGHAAGDEVLKQVCERISMTLTGTQRLGRVGGDEFVIVMPDTPIPLASLICRGIVERIGGVAYRVGDKAFQVRGSVGLIEVSTGMPMRDVISTADRACRQAKEASDGLVIYERNASAFHEREAELNLVAKLQGPNATDGLFIEMQPIMSLKTPRDSLNFEVLLRMRGPDGRVMPAGPLIGAAEKSGRAGVIDRWVLTTTLGWIAEHITRLPNTRFVCMNLSGASLNDERFVADTLEILARHVHVASRLCVEITESVALHDLDNTRRFIDQVRNFGVKVALDDFGAGYTSFSYLKELPADVLKIDGNFIVNINAHPANVAIVEAIVNLAVNLGMKTIAEWAEDAATVQTLAEIGVDYVQGWAVARSLPPENMLTASSSASFIQDRELLELLPTLGNGAALDLLGMMRLP